MTYAFGRRNATFFITTMDHPMMPSRDVFFLKFL